MNKIKFEVTEDLTYCLYAISYSWTLCHRDDLFLV